jgi:hypothetical protein
MFSQLCPSLAVSQWMSLFLRLKTAAVSIAQSMLGCQALQINDRLDKVISSRSLVVRRLC